MIRVKGLAYAVGSFRLEVSLEVARGEYFMLMGPPGSGKTALVECLAGLRRPQAGRIEIAGREVTAAEPRERGIGYVPQDYALFNHKTVAGNIAFGPRVRGWPAGQVEQAVHETARLVGIDHLLDRRIAGLSGGERQRTALARALALRPDVLVLDEPVSALDESTRESLCAELRKLQRELGLTTIHISHNLEEAFSVADRGGVMRDGRFQQIGLLQDLLRRPANEFVARFMRCENILDGQATGPGPGDTTRLEVDGQVFLSAYAHQGPVKLVVRPENVNLARTAPREGAPCAAFSMNVVRAVDRGAYVRVELDGAMRLLAHVSPHAYAELGAPQAGPLVATVAPDAIHVLQSAPSVDSQLAAPSAPLDTRESHRAESG